MGCNTCTNDKRHYIIEPLQILTPPFTSSKIHFTFENSLKFFSFSFESQSMSNKEVEGSKTFLDKYKTFPEFFRVANMHNNLYICGGKTSQGYLNTNFKIEVVNDVFNVTECAVMLECKCSMAIANINECAFVIAGGFNSHMLTTVEIYKAYSNKWIVLNSLNVGRYNASACLVNQKFLYVVGGLTTNEVSVVTIERLNVLKKNEKWNIVPLYSSEFCGCIEAGVFQKSFNEIIICGGYVNDDYTKETYVFDITLGRITKGEEMKEKDVLISTFGYKDENEVYGFGITGKVHLYNSLNNTWKVFKLQDTIKTCTLKANS